MMKKMFLFFLSVVFIQGTVFGDLTLIQPQGGVLVMGTTYPIKWTAPNSEGEQRVHIYLGEKLIADHCKKKDGFFNWKVGQLKNGSYVAPGHYSIVLESLDGDAFGKKFAIIAMIPKWLNKIRSLEVFPRPNDCPVCYQVDLRKIKAMIKMTKERFHLKLYRNRRLLASLGQLGGGSVLPDFAKIKIPRDKRVLVRKSSGFQYELKLFDSRGKLVESQRVTLVFKKQR
ncbi:MAG: hypothetical protein GTO45_20775 [Candidatus Aminicenantes bacterium]|nr:hypothetical protein [Candidatus Aminicenantes bacterium]NIM81222.1 hypothetical protein [Candidatus Aminicenantes bacterium]NIN20597.1 hypothetical protein [Candidatus Aminicenantes bacterium]NIN44376.1 hypothetical protein [Candidatus Aminicenantes bacterium]NIN87195.1 hypothetical protein [Candidatus Aminicenantes bacterium]